jgi:hypothetical protein
LPASEAHLHGHQLRYETGDHHDNIGSWTDGSDWVDWEFKLLKPGKYHIIADYAAPKAAAIEVSIGDQKRKTTLPLTDDYANFKSATVGWLELNTPGMLSLIVHPIADGWHPINLKAIRLKPKDS